MTEDQTIGNVDAAIGAGVELAKVTDRITNVENVPVGLVPSGMHLKVLDDALKVADQRAPTPRRRKGTAQHQELPSFIEHVNRFKDADSAIFADIAQTKLTAVLDYHPSGADKGPRWGEHRSVYTCPKSRQWLLWTSHQERAFTQEAFGEFVDANMADLASPSAGGAVSTDVAEPAAVLTMARNLVVLTKGEYSRAINPTTGESSLVNKIENESTSTKIPRAFLLQLPVFENGTLYAVEARVRFAMRDGRPTFSFVLYQPEKIVQDAFGAVRDEVKKGTGLPVFAGSPE